MATAHDATRLAALGREWIAAWNSRDLERVLALYAERGARICEYLRLDAEGKIVQGSANHLAQ